MSDTIKRGSGKRAIVFVTGCFDIIHTGHIRFLKQAKSYGDKLLVGLGSDIYIRKTKGEHRPIISQKDRKEVLKAIRYVDDVYITNSFEHAANIAKSAHVTILVFYNGEQAKKEKREQIINTFCNIIPGLTVKYSNLKKVLSTTSIEKKILSHHKKIMT